jgi:hypothetical protein
MAPTRSEDIRIWSSRLALVMALVIDDWRRDEISRTEARQKALELVKRALGQLDLKKSEGALLPAGAELPSAVGDDALRLAMAITADDGSELVVAVQYRKATSG